MIDRVKEKLAELKADNDRLNKILQEIKEIAGHFECDCPSAHICICSSCNKLDEILDLITKAEEE